MLAQQMTKYEDTVLRWSAKQVYSLEFIKAHINDDNMKSH